MKPACTGLSPTTLQSASGASLTVPATRAGYYALQSTARAVLKGYRVVLPDGETIHVPELMKC